VPMVENEITAVPIKPVQYGMRSLLVVMSVMAVLAAIGSNYYRRCSPEGQPYLLVLWGSFLLAMACFYWSYERMRLKNCAGSGKCLMRLPSVSYHFWASSSVTNWVGIFLFCLAAIMFIFHSSQCEQMATQGSFYSIATYLIAAMRGTICAMHVVFGLFLIRAGNEVQLCENGVLKQGLIQWKEISRITPNLGTKHDDRTVYSIQGNPMFRVPTKLREQVDALIVEKLGNGSG